MDLQPRIGICERHASGGLTDGLPHTASLPRELLHFRACRGGLVYRTHPPSPTHFASRGISRPTPHGRRSQTPTLPKLELLSMGGGYRVPHPKSQPITRTHKKTQQVKSTLQTGSKHAEQPGPYSICMAWRRPIGDKHILGMAYIDLVDITFDPSCKIRSNPIQSASLTHTMP